MNISSFIKTEYKEHMRRELRENREYAKGKKIITVIAISMLILKLLEYPGEYLSLGKVTFDFSHFITIALLVAITIIVIEGVTFLGSIFYLYNGLTALSQILLVSYYFAGEGKAMAIEKFIQDNGMISIFLIFTALANIAAGICLVVLPQVRSFNRRTKEIKSEYPKSPGQYYK